MSLPPLLDVAVFEAIGIDRLLGLVLVYFLAFFVKGAIGVGSLTPTIVFSALLIDPHRAVALALMANSLSQLQFVRAGFRDGDWKIARRVVIPNFMGAAIGVWIFGQIAGSELSLLLGLALGSLVLADIAGVWGHLAERLNIAYPGTILALSGFAGLVSGVTGAAGLLFLVPYLRIVCIDKLRFRGTVLLLGTIIVTWRTVIMAVSGHIDLQIVIESLILLPAVIGGGFAGTMCYAAVSERRFSGLLQTVILLGASILIWRGLHHLLFDG